MSTQHSSPDPRTASESSLRDSFAAAISTLQTSAHDSGDLLFLLPDSTRVYAYSLLLDRATHGLPPSIFARSGQPHDPCQGTFPVSEEMLRLWSVSFGALKEKSGNCSVDRSHVFVLPDGSWREAYYDASGRVFGWGSEGIPLEVFSSTEKEAELETPGENGWGRPTRVFAVSELMESALRECLRRTYSPECLASVSELILSQPDLRLPQLDYTVHLKDEKTEETLATFHAPRFLLSARIPYFRRLFSGGFSDSGSDSSSLYTPTFTAASLRILLQHYIYTSSPPPTSLLNLPSLPSTSAKPTVFDACTKPSAPYATSPDIVCPPSLLALPRTSHIVATTLSLAEAAFYLELPDLQSWASAHLHSLSHRLLCSDTGCASFLPHIWHALSTSEHDLAERWDWARSIPAWLSQTPNIPRLWKRSLLNLPPALLATLVRTVEDTHLTRSSHDLASLYLALEKLSRLTASSKQATKWRTSLLDPLTTSCSRAAAASLGDGVVLCQYARNTLNTAPLGELLYSIARSLITPENCRGVFQSVFLRPTREVMPRLEDARTEAQRWFRRNWLSLSLRENRAYTGSRKCFCEVPVFFEEWTQGELVRLAEVVGQGVSVKDLLGNPEKRGWGALKV